MAEPHHESRRKTIRFTDKQEEDYISLLPDCLLIEIISRLPETKEAIRTGTLSKRWQHLWPYVHNLIFIDEKGSSRIERFVSLVYKTLTQCRQSNLNKFKIHTGEYVNDKQKLNNWVHHAVSRKVQDLDLSLPALVLDEFICINSCLTRLKLEYCSLNPTRAISWSKLMSLTLTGMDFHEDWIQNILSGCPLLETLKLKFCCGFRRLDITSKSVKNFMFTKYKNFALRAYYADLYHWGELYDYEEPDEIIEINAPYIVSLTIADDLWLSKLLLVDVSCLVKAQLDYKMRGDYGVTCEEHEEMLKGLILSLRHVKELKVGKSCLEVLSRLEDKGFSFPSNMVHPDDWPDYDSSESVDWFNNDSTESGDQ